MKNPLAPRSTEFKTKDTLLRELQERADRGEIVGGAVERFSKKVNRIMDAIHDQGLSSFPSINCMVQEYAGLIVIKLFDYSRPKNPDNPGSQPEDYEMVGTHRVVKLPGFMRTKPDQVTGQAA